MPELPEVEYTARQLRDSAVGAEICHVQVFWERIIGHPGASTFVVDMRGRRISGVRRRGKFLLLDLAARDGHGNDAFVSIHRRMTGNLLLLPPGWKIDTSLRERDATAWDTRGPTFIPPDPNVLVSASSYPIKLSDTAYCRACFTFSDGRMLLYTDQRKFGRIECWPLAEEAAVFADLGLEPLGVDFTGEALASALAGRKSALKQVLLDQTVIAGLGNIYADEALYAARLHPLRPANSLTPGEVAALRECIVAALSLGIKHGGTSFSDYRGLGGEAGDNLDHLLVYQRDGEPCKHCDTLIERIVIAQRSAHYCPRCQPLAVSVG